MTITELRNHGGEAIDRVGRGEVLTVTRGGQPVAELRPLARAALPAEVLLARWHGLPAVDPEVLRADLDAVLDPRR